MIFDHAFRLPFGALSLSLLLHLLALLGWGWAHPVPPAVPSATMQVVVVAGPAAAAPAEMPRRVKLATPSVPPAVQPKAQKKGAPVTATAVEKAAALDVRPLPGVAAAPAAAEASAGGAAGAAPTMAGDSISDDGLRQYRIELATAARRFRSYPAIARSRGWEGVAEVTVAVHAGLPLPSLRLVKSSGHAVLDEQALEMLSRAVASTTVPDSLRGKSFVVPMPIRFSLQD